MTTITKTECEAILERLTDKSLTFGCEVSNNHQPDGNPYKIRTFIHKTSVNGKLLYKCMSYDGSSGNFKPDLLTILGHPVTMLDVLARKSQDFWMEPMKVGTSNLDKLYFYWSECGIQTPLHNILEGAEWEWRCNGCDSTVWASINCCPDHPRIDPEKRTTETLKDKKVEALFLFLKQIGL